MSILNKLYKNLSFAIYCFPHGTDRRFVAGVKEMEKSANIVRLKDVSISERECKPIYYIHMEESHAGFCRLQQTANVFVFCRYIFIDTGN